MTENSLETEIISRIKRAGKISFAEFMEIALYDKEGGYYTKPDVFGAEGDFFTSPAAHPIFGALLAVQLKVMWDALGKPDPFYAIEMGAGNGILSRDLLAYAGGLSEEFTDSLVYVAADRYSTNDVNSTEPQKLQGLMSTGIPLKGVVGCFLSNELLDSFPIHRFQIQEGTVKETFVTLDNEDKLVEVLDTPSTAGLTQRIKALDSPLPEGFRGEVNVTGLCSCGQVFHQRR